jgi:hypothetical protein
MDAIQISGLVEELVSFFDPMGDNLDGKIRDMLFRGEK